MKTRHSIRKLLTGVLLGAASLSCASASTFLVNWGGSYLEEGTPDNRVTTERGTTSINQTSLKGVLYGYNDATPLLAPSSYYSGTSATFYGAVQLTTPQRGIGSEVSVRSLGPASGDDWADRNRIYIQSPLANVNQGNIPASTEGMLFWKKEDFLAGGGTDPIALSQLERLYVNASFGRVSNSTIRFAVQSNGEWYLSQKVLTTGQKLAVALGTLTLTDIENSLWAQWNMQDTPTSLLNAAPTVYDVQASSLTDVTAIGVYFAGTYQLSNAAIFGFEEFSVTAAIPEPATAMLFGGSSLVLLGGMAAKRRLRNR